MTNTETTIALDTRRIPTTTEKVSKSIDASIANEGALVALECHASQVADVERRLGDEAERVSSDGVYSGVDVDGNRWCVRVTAYGSDVANTDDTVTVESMPDWLRASHRAARNWGVYPHNGAQRTRVSREEAEEIVAADPDGYARIVE